MIQMFLPGLSHTLLSVRKKYERKASYTFEEGMYIINHFKQKKLHGVEIDGLAEPQSTRIRMFKAGRTTCVSCGIKGNHFYVERHRNDKKGAFSFNLYAIKNNVEVMLTWDHILPKALGGGNGLLNAQCMCEVCNRAKGCRLSLTELVEIASHKDFVAMNNITKHELPLKTDLRLKKILSDVRDEMHDAEQRVKKAMELIRKNKEEKYHGQI